MTGFAIELVGGPLDGERRAIPELSSSWCVAQSKPEGLAFWGDAKTADPKVPYRVYVYRRTRRQHDGHRVYEHRGEVIL